MKSILCCATASDGVSLAQPAAAQTETQIQTIEQQIKALQAQLNQFTAELAARDDALKAAQQQAAPPATAGNPNVNLSGCYQELGSCSGVTSAVVEGTLGGWWRVIRSIYGTVPVGAQYAYVYRNTYRGVGATKGSRLSPSTSENMFLFSLRYLRSSDRAA